MFDKLIVLYTANYNLKTDYFFGISYLLKKGVNVEFWNLSNLLLHEQYPKIDLPKGLVEITLVSYKEFYRLVKLNKDALYATPIGFDRGTYAYCKILSKCKVCVLFGNFGALPNFERTVGHKTERLVNWSKKIKKIKCSNIWWFFKRQLFKTFFFKPATYVLKSAKLAEDFYKTDQSTIILYGSSSDYNNFMMSKEKAQVERPYIVFIDQNIAYHPENGTLGKDMCTDPLGYFDKMNALFDTLEKLYSCDIIICAHPTSVFLEDDNKFKGRRIEFGKTQEYVRDSIGVISHNSTALSFAVMWEKPILLVTTNDIEQNMPYGARVITNFRDLLGCAYVNLDKDKGNDYFRSINREKYTDYRENYLSLNTEKNNGEVLYELFERNNVKWHK